MQRSWLGAIGRGLAQLLRGAAVQFRQRPWLVVLVVVLLVPGMLLILSSLFVLALFLTRVIWAWAIPDLFPGAVQEGLIAATISWYTALKIVVALLFFGIIANASFRHESQGR